MPGCRCSLVLYPAPLPARLIPASLRSIRVCCRKTVATRCKVPGRSRYHTVELILTKKGVHSCLYLIAHSNLTKIYLRKCCNRLAMLNFGVKILAGGNDNKLRKQVLRHCEGFMIQNKVCDESPCCLCLSPGNESLRERGQTAS